MITYSIISINKRIYNESNFPVTPFLASDTVRNYTTDDFFQIRIRHLVVRPCIVWVTKINIEKRINRAESVDIKHHIVAFEQQFLHRKNNK